MREAPARLTASRERLRAQLLAARDADETDPAQVLDLLGAAAALGGASMRQSLWRWAQAELVRRGGPAVRAHPILAVTCAAAVGFALLRGHWNRPLLSVLASHVERPQPVGSLAQRRAKQRS